MVWFGPKLAYTEPSVPDLNPIQHFLDKLDPKPDVAHICVSFINAFVAERELNHAVGRVEAVIVALF